MDLRKLKTLVDLVAESGISELEVTEDDGKVRIVNNRGIGQGQGQGPGQSAPVQMMAPVAVAAAPVPVALDPAAPVPVQGKTVKSPMVGTFYRSASPGGKPFVEVGNEVKEGQAVCIIEAMKLLNEIETEFSGVVKQILVDNGQSVEFGQPLMIIG